jgi:hypothetical protein
MLPRQDRPFRNWSLSPPTLRKVREELGSLCVAEAREIKSLGHPPCATVEERRFSAA